ncbi:MAG: helix-turn-helix domain-containing protein [Actinomycetota bacterium]
MKTAGEVEGRLLRAGDVAGRIGASKQAVYLLARENVLPSVRWGRSVRFDPADVEAFIREHRREGATPKDAA